MDKSSVRLFVSMCLALVTCSSALATSAARPTQDALTWQALIGGASADQALQAQAFLPTTLTINEGDTVSWTLNAFVHTVTFLSGGERPADVVPSDEGPLLNPAVAFPAGGPSYDGTGFVNSGILDQKGATFSLTFTKPGTYNYLCLLHPGMDGKVVVQPAGSAYPLTQAQIDAQANAELANLLALAQRTQENVQLTSKVNSDSTTSYTVVNGIGGGQASVLRFLPGELTVKPGDSVSWPVQDPHEIHTVTFYDPAGPVPQFIEPRPQPTGPPKLAVPHAAPEGGTKVEHPGLYNSGILGPKQSYTFTFPMPGVYPYVCVVHADQGMFGLIRVQVGALPDTSAGTPVPALYALAGGAVLLMLLGVLLRQRWARGLLLRKSTQGGGS
jgi:plastocyanin